MSEFVSLKETLSKIDVQIGNLESIFKDKLKNVNNEVKRVFKSIPKVQEELVDIENRIKADDVKAERLRQTRGELELQISSTNEETGQLKEELILNQQENVALEGTFRTLDSQINQETWAKSSTEKDSEQIRHTATDLAARIDAKKKANENEFIEKKLHLDQVKRELVQLEEKEVIISYLLKEGSQDIPEVDILSVLKDNPVVQLEAIKENSSMPPAMVNRTLIKLQERGIIDYDQGRGVIKLIKDFLR